MSGTQRRKRQLVFGGLALGALVASAAVATTAVADPTKPAGPRVEQAPAHGPVGWETYRNPERLAEISTDARTKQFSSFDRTGGNDDGFEGTYSCLRTTDAGCVIAEDTGAGELSSIWFTRDNGNVTATGNIRIELDGQPPVVDAPLQDVVNGALLEPFVYPLVANAEQSSGGVYIKVPMTYHDSMRVTVQNNPLFHHVTYREFADPEGVPTFDPDDPANDVIDKLAAAGTADPKPEQPNPDTSTEAFDIPAGEATTLASASGSGALTQLALTIPQLEPDGSDDILRNARIRISFDGQRTVDSPLGEFYGSGLGLYAVRSLMFGIDPEARTLSSWWLMPYGESAEVELVNDSGVALTGEATVGTSTDAKWGEDLAAGRTGYFRTTSVQEDATFGNDHVFLDTTGQGRVVGVTQTVEGLIPSGNTRNYLEGDERVFVDGSASPDLHGTGTEDFYEGGWYFSRGTFNAPTNGNPSHEEPGIGGCQYDCTGLYRLLLADGIDFSSKIRFSIEHGPANDADAVYGSTTYWYGQPNNELAWTDTVDVGNTQSENAHAYTSDNPGQVTRTSSRFEGIDGAEEIVRLDGRATSAEVSFDVAVPQDNEGVQLRRISNQSEGYQVAEVSVNGEPAGTWTQPLANPVQQWLDDSFRLPASLTSGKQSLTVTLTPVSGGPAWDAASYSVLARVPNANDANNPSGVTDLAAALGDSDTTINLTWRPVTDDVYAPRYEVHASQTADFTPSEQTLAGIARTPGYTFIAPDVNQTWYFKVRAIDATGKTGPISNQAQATTGNTRRIEAESLLQTATGTAPFELQGDCCGVTWSGHAQLWVRATEAGQTVTVEFDTATAGTYDISASQTVAPDYGINVLRLDDQQIGEALDAYNAGAVETREIAYGSHQLAAGTHSLTLEVTGTNGSSAGHFAGLDYLQLTLTGDAGATGTN